MSTVSNFIPGVTAGLLLVTKSGRLMQLTHSQARTNDRRTCNNHTACQSADLSYSSSRHCPLPDLHRATVVGKEVSVRFNVSRQPVREAFIKLAENGLIQIRPQRGSYVNKLTVCVIKISMAKRQFYPSGRRGAQWARRAASMIT